MRIEPLDPADEKAVRACHDVMLAAHKADEPVEPPTSYAPFCLYLREGWEKTPGEVWYAVDDAGAVNGFYRMHLPDLENLDRATGGPVVHPAVRRRGIGRELLSHEGARAEANGRSLFSASTTEGTAGDAFAQAVGARLDLEEVRRLQYLREIPPGKIASLRASAEKAAAGYSLLSWAGATPDEYCGALAEVFNAFNDAPHGENEEPEIWTPSGSASGRHRHARRPAARLRHGRVQRHDRGDGRVQRSHRRSRDPPVGFQQLTAVIRSHRGQRLGLLVKTAMLELLASAEPELEWIVTGNAATNEHMIAVNDQLGYKVVEPGWRFYEMPVANMR